MLRGNASLYLLFWICLIPIYTNWPPISPHLPNFSLFRLFSCHTLPITYVYLPYCSYTIRLYSLLGVYYLNIRLICANLFGYLPNCPLLSAHCPTFPIISTNFPYAEFSYFRAPDGIHLIFPILGALRTLLHLPFSRTCYFYRANRQNVTSVKSANR